MKQQAITVDEQQGKIVSVAGGNYRMIITGEQTGGAFAIIHMEVPPHGGPGPHAHADFQESFYVLSGEVEVKTETQTYIAKQGSFVSIPEGGIVHCFKNKSDKVAQLLCTVVPAGLDSFFLELGTPVEKMGVFLPPKAPAPEELQHMKAVAEKYGQQLFPPDYLDKQG